MAPTGTVLVSAYVPLELANEFKARAESEDRSLSATMRQAMKAYLAQPENGR